MGLKKNKDVIERNKRIVEDVEEEVYRNDMTYNAAFEEVAKRYGMSRSYVYLVCTEAGVGQWTEDQVDRWEEITHKLRMKLCV